MKTPGILTAILLLSGIVAFPLHAADPVQPWQLRLSSNIIGSRVHNLRGESLGDIKDMVINPEDNQVVYAVISFGGVLGLGEKLFAVPLKVMKRSAEANTFIIDVAQERLKNAPEFNRDNWPQMTDPRWIASVYDFYGLKPYWQP
jgi:sporulation protein YlmC with PRC-barrel domain